MYKRILVPLDGSKLAECALSHVEEIAKCCGSDEVILVSVTERVRLSLDSNMTMVTFGDYGDYPVRTDSLLGIEAQGHSEVRQPIELKPGYFGKKEKQAQKYLDRIKQRLEAKGITIKTAVLSGKPAEEITNYASYRDCDLIIIASHGRSGISRWAYGSVAEKVFRSSCAPIMMVRAPGCIPGFI